MRRRFSPCAPTGMATAARAAIAPSHAAPGHGCAGGCGRDAASTRATGLDGASPGLDGAWSGPAAIRFGEVRVDVGDVGVPGGVSVVLAGSAGGDVTATVDFCPEPEPVGTVAALSVPTGATFPPAWTFRRSTRRHRLAWSPAAPPASAWGSAAG